MPQGGNPTQMDVNLPFEGLEFHYIFILLCSFIVFFILPGIGFLYSGLARRKAALSFLFQAFMILAV